MCLNCLATHELIREDCAEEIDIDNSDMEDYFSSTTVDNKNNDV